jgi:hypothetical protein
LKSDTDEELTMATNKPGGETKDDGSTRPVDDLQAVKNQSSVKPEDYPAPAGGSPDQTRKR